jgi:SAM-dependent methyltransferase
MTARPPRLDQLRRFARRIPGVVTLVRLLRRLVDPRLREIHRLRRTHRDLLFQPFTDTCEERYPALFDAIAARLDHLDAPRLLSFGCSSGAEVRALRRRLPLAQIVGIDLNRRMIAAARLADPDPRSDYRCAGSPDPDERFDAILALAVFRHGELEADRPAQCTHVLPFARFAAGVAALDACLDEGGLLAIWNAHFRLADCELADRYESIAVEVTGCAPQVLLYGADDRRLDGASETRALFRKVR